MGELNETPLTNAAPIALLASDDRERGRDFYQHVLGLRLSHEDGFALVFDVAGTTLRVAIVEQLTPAPYAVFGWQVPDVDAAIDVLAQRGVSFNRYGGMEQDARGVWRSPSGARIAWFLDPSGNVLSVSES